VLGETELESYKKHRRVAADVDQFKGFCDETGWLKREDKVRLTG